MILTELPSLKVHCNLFYKKVHYQIVSDISQKCCIQTKMYRLYRKMIIKYGHYFLLSIHFYFDKSCKCLNTKMYRLYRKMTI